MFPFCTAKVFCFSMHCYKYETDFVFLKHMEFLSTSLCPTLFVGVDIIMGDNMLRQRRTDLRSEKRKQKPDSPSTTSLFQVLYPEGDEVCDVSGQSTIPVPPEVKRIAVNKNSGETLLHRAARLGNEVSDTALGGWMDG